MKVKTQRRPFRLLGVALLALSATAVGASIAVSSTERDVSPLTVTAAPKDDPKPIIKTVRKAVVRAVTTVREVPEIVDRAAQVPAGQLQPCSESEPVVDFEEAITQNALQQVAAFLGAAPGTPADSTANTVLPTFSEVMGIADQVHGASLETLEEALRRLLKLHVLSLLIDEAEQCPEFVERVVTTAITALRSEEPEEPDRETT